MFSPLLFVALALAYASPSRADVIVLANRTAEQITFHLVADEVQQKMVIAAGQQRVLPARATCQLHYRVSDELVRYQLDANAVYFFALNEQGWLDLRQVDLGGTLASSGSTTATPPDTIVELPVKVLVDNYDPTPRPAWEKRLRQRFAKVSDILEDHCRLRLKIVAVGTWDSGTGKQSFKQTLIDFRRQVDPMPARLAIGFTGRYQQEAGRVDLGATQGMLQSHILIREWAATMSEPERAEVLLHEIGHYLGAVHSPDSMSVMRPILADDQAIHRAFQIGFDPVNTLIVNLVAEEIRTHQTESVNMLSEGGRRRLLQIYKALATTMPRDKSIRQYISQLSMVEGSSLTRATRMVVSEIRRSAQSRGGIARQRADQLSTDRLTELYVRQAATTATRLPRDVARSAFLLGLGIALDDSDTLLRNPLTAGFCRQVETAAERLARRRALGGPTMRGRRDLAQHFFLSAYLTAAVGASAAESAGLVKELADSRSSSGFSYRDLAADMAGIHFAQQLLDGNVSLDDVARGPATLSLMPHVADLPEGIPWSEIGAQLKRNKPRQQVMHYRSIIRRRVSQLSEERVAVERPARHPVLQE